MPLPKPRKGESRDAFMNRCMRDSDLPTSSDPSHNQRLGACASAWNSRSKDDDLTGRGALRIRMTLWDQE